MTEPVPSPEASPTGAALSPAEVTFDRRRRTLGLVLGPTSFLLVLALPLAELQPPAHRLAAVLVWAVVWWVSEAVPIPVTALLGPTLMVVLGIAPVKEAMVGFGDPVLFLFLGSFTLAAAMSRHGLDRRLAYRLLASRLAGSSATATIAAFAVLSTVLSMWISNTATTAMLCPIALGVLAAISRLLEQATGKPVDAARLRFGAALLLASAYGASIGGVATPVGTPPNLIALGQLATLAGVKIPFFHWMVIGLPIALAMLVVLIVVLRLALPPELGVIPGGTAFIAAELARLGRPGRGERNVMVAFALAVTLWVLPGIVALIAGTDSALCKGLSALLPESVVALVAVVLLFVLPVDWAERRFTLSWAEAVQIDWGTLLLFGGGLSLGAAMFSTGLAHSLGNALTSITGAHSTLALTYVFTVTGILLTELTSNTAVTTMLVPLAIAAAQAAGVDPVAPGVGCALGCSMAFMLPVATPPNAIVYGTGCVPITTMIRVGCWLVAAAALLIPPAVVLLVRLVS